MVDSPAVTPGPMIPDYAGANVRGIIPALLGPGKWNESLPSWFPEPVAHAEQVVLLILDGLGWEQLEQRRALMPALSSMVGGAITTVAPSTTATALSSIATGLTPAEHGLLGYRMMMGGEVINVLRWNTPSGDRRRSHPPRDVQPYTAFLGHQIPVVSPADLQGTAFTEAHLRGSRPVGWRVGLGDLRRGRPGAPGRGALRVRLLRRHRQDRPRTGLRRLLRRRAALRRPPRRRRPRRPAAGGGPARHRRSRAGARGRSDHRPGPRAAGDGRRPVGRGPVPLVARSARARSRSWSPAPRSSTATTPGWSPASR